MAIVMTGSAPATSGKSDGQTYRAALAMVTILFFFWGFVTVLNDILVPHLKSIFDLNYTKVMLIQFAFFSAYFIFSIPSAKVIDTIGYKRTMVTGLVTISIYSGGKRAIVSIIFGRADGAGGGDYGTASCGQCICFGFGTAGDSVEPIEFDAGV